MIVQGFFIADGKPNAGAFNLDQFARYVNPTFMAQYWQIFVWTIQMGVLSAVGSTVLGFLFAYTVVRCNIPFKRGVHALTLLPTISPPFAIAIAAILLFGRTGLVTKDILHMEFKAGDTGIYGMNGLVFVQIITFFSVAYLIIRGMLERIDPSMEEAALSLGASKWHIFRTITLPLLTPGIAASFLLMFVESLADLGNPVFIGGNVTVLSTQIWIAVNGEFNQQKGAALSLILLAADADGLHPAALLGLAQVVHFRDGQADGRRSRFCERAADPVDVHYVHLPDPAPRPRALRDDLSRFDHQAVGHRLYA